MAWQKNGTPDTLSSPADVLSIPDLTPLVFNVTLTHTSDITSTCQHDYRWDDISTNTYASRRSVNGGSSGAGVPNATSILMGSQTVNKTYFDIIYTINIDGEEKLMMGWNVFSNTTGSGSSPERSELVGKATQSPQFTRVDQVQLLAGDYGTDSNMSALGTD